MTSDLGLRVISKSSAASSWRRRLTMLLFTDPNVMSEEPGGRVASTSTMVDMGGLVGLLVGRLVRLVALLVSLVGG